MSAKYYVGASCVLITDNMDRIVLPASMLGAMRRARDFARRSGNISAQHPLHIVVDNAEALPGAISLSRAPNEQPSALFADVKPRNGKVGDSDKCPICLVEWGGDDDDVVVSRCAHAFHRQCIREWVQPHKCGNGQQRNTCPMCRAQL